MSKPSDANLLTWFFTEWNSGQNLLIHLLQGSKITNKKANIWVPGCSIESQTISRLENHTPPDLHI